MKKATIREVQHNLAAVLRQVESGEEFQILRRKHPIAMIVPIRAESSEKTVDWSEHRTEVEIIFDGRVVTGKTVADLVSEGRGTY